MLRRHILPGAVALAGVIAGGLTVIVWKQLEGGWFGLYEIVPGVVIAIVAVASASLIWPGPAQGDERGFSV